MSPRAQSRVSPRARTVPHLARIRIDVADEGTRSPLGTNHVRRIAAAVLQAERIRAAVMSITLVSDAEMRRLNRRHLGRRRLTDVIAFALPSAGGVITGDVYIAPGAARRYARQHDVTVAEELTRLVIHGVLHVLGWDHPEGTERMQSAMWRRQEALVTRVRRRVA